MTEEKVVTVNEIVGSMIDLEEEEKQLLYDVMQAITMCHDICLGSDENIEAVKKELADSGLSGDDHFDYWFYTILFTVLAWRKGFDKATTIGYGSFAGALTQAMTGNADEWVEFSQGLSRTRPTAEMVTDFIFGFKVPQTEGENEET